MVAEVKDIKWRSMVVGAKKEFLKGKQERRKPEGGQLPNVTEILWHCLHSLAFLVELIQVFKVIWPLLKVSESLYKL